MTAFPQTARSNTSTTRGATPRIGWWKPSPPRVPRSTGLAAGITCSRQWVARPGHPPGHMVIAARSRSIHGPWEQHPGNPLVHTRQSLRKPGGRAAMPHWSRRRTAAGGPCYHGYEKGYWTLGRQCLLDPVEFGSDGWFQHAWRRPVAAHSQAGHCVNQADGRPGRGTAVTHAQPLSDDFSQHARGLAQDGLSFKPGADEQSLASGWIPEPSTSAGKGDAPSSGSPLLLTPGDRSYSFECDIECAPGGRAGLVLFYDERLYCGLGFDADRFVVHQYGLERGRPTNPHGATNENSGHQPSATSLLLTPVAMAEKPGAVSTAAWRFPATTTTSVADS